MLTNTDPLVQVNPTFGKDGKFRAVQVVVYPLGFKPGEKLDTSKIQCDVLRFDENRT